MLYACISAAYAVVQCMFVWLVGWVSVTFVYCIVSKRLKYGRANSTLGFLRRNLRRCPVKVKETAYVFYIMLVRSTFEYSAPVWDPHLVRDCDLLEKIQRRSARFFKGEHRTTSSVTHMLHDLGWRDLSDRLRDLRLALFYKVVTGHLAVGLDQIGLVAADKRTRVNHRFKFRAIGSIGVAFGQSFFTDLDFADDVSLLAELLKLLVPILEKIASEAASLGFEVNWQKTKVQALG